MASSGFVDTDFPAVSLVPKIETAVLSFLQKYPEFDGRDTVIAIFDSGVDPRASGLETICDGSVKVIERFDCSGCGDTDVSKKVTADAKSRIVGLSGRSLKITPEMVSANTANGGEFGIGLRAVGDLYPQKVRETCVANEKLKTWDKPHKTATADVMRQMSEFESQNTDTSKLSWDKKLEKENLDNALEFLNNYEKAYPDIKTFYDIIVYPTANGWQAVIDTTLKGDLANAVHIGEYSKTREMKNLDDYLSVSMNIHDEGNVCEIVGMCSSHGTHVAAIASGNHASKDINGVAPNAQIVSLTIGDGRLGSMETGTALVRGMMKVIELCESGKKVDVINMSYGEHAGWSNCGRIGELMSEVVNKYGVVWVASAGNHGPALSTIGTPPDISQPSCLGVGAYVSPQMMEAEYSLREKLPANLYTWTSRDPCIDGGRGVTVCAPGAAITSVPQFTMCKSQLMNGTSMASPHVAGAVALLISGLKQKGVPFSPFSIKRAICATASKVSYADPFAQGSGLLNVEKAFEHLLQYRNAPENLLRFSVRCGPQNAKGIHLREGFLKKPYECSVDVEPIFLNDKEADPKGKLNFNVRLNLISSQPFVQCGAYLDLCYNSRTISVKVDPTGLPPGVHTAFINAYDSNAVDKGSLFEIPVTIVQPHVIDTEQTRVFEHPTSIEFQPNTIQRDFILVPNKATWAVLKMRSTDANRDKDIGKFFVHTMQLLPAASCRKLETMKIINVTTESDTIWPFKVQANNILELCIAKYWSNFGNTHVKYSLEFHGIMTSPRATIMHVAKGIHEFNVSALGREDFQPSIQLKTAAVVLKPTESKITPLSPTRDIIPPGRQIYQNVLTYTLNVAKAQETVLYAPLFNSLLYESEFESQLWMLFDTNKMLIASGDAHSHSFYTKLEKGEYTVRLQIRHEKKDALEKISEATMVALFKLTNPLSLDIYDHYNQCIVAGRKFTSCLVKDVVPKVVYVAPLNNEKLTKAALPSGTVWLNGALSLAKDEIGRRVHILKFQYHLIDGGASSSSSSSSGASTSNKKANGTGAVATAANTGNGNGGGNGAGNGSAGKNNNGGSSPKKTATKAGKDDYLEALRDFQCSMITKIELEKAEELCNTVLAAHPKHLAALLAYVQNIESTQLKSLLPFSFVKYINGKDTEAKPDIVALTTTLESIVEKTNTIIKETDKDALLAYYGIKNDTRPDAAKIKTNMEKQKTTLLEALCKKGIAIAKLNVIEKGSQNPARLEEIDGIFVEIGKFTDATDAKVVNFNLWHAYSHKHHGRMVKILQKMYDEKRNREVYDEMALVAGSAEWQHIQEAIERQAVSANPTSYRLF